MCFLAHAREQYCPEPPWFACGSGLDGFYFDAPGHGIATCRKCSAGKFSISGETCKNCEAGFTSREGASTCTQCAERGASTGAPPCSNLTESAIPVKEVVGALVALAACAIAVCIWRRRRRMPSPPPHNKKSISVRNLEALKNMLSAHPFFREVTTEEFCCENIRQYLLAGNPHPAVEHADLFSDLDPSAVLTYEWRLSMDQIFLYLAQERLEACARTWRLTALPTTEDLRIWIDVLFIDQLSDQLHFNLRDAKKIFTETEFHLILLTETVFTRAWCLWELAVRYQPGNYTYPLKKNNELLEVPFEQNHDFFGNMQASKERDKQLIQRRIKKAFNTKNQFNVSMQSIIRGFGT